MFTKLMQAQNWVLPLTCFTMDFRIFCTSLSVMVSGSSCCWMASWLRFSSFSVTMVLNLVFSSKRKSTVLGESGKRCIKKQVASNKQQKTQQGNESCGGGGVSQLNLTVFILIFCIMFGLIISLINNLNPPPPFQQCICHTYYNKRLIQHPAAIFYHNLQIYGFQLILFFK